MDQEVVLLSQVLAQNCNIGSETHRNLVLQSFNGVVVRSLKHLKHLIDVASGGVTLLEVEETKPNSNSFVFEFQNGNVMVLNREAALAAQQQVMYSCLFCYFYYF